CDFCLWPDKPEPGAFTLPMGGAHKGTTVPMLSRWRMHEQHSGLPGLAQMQYVFLELPKYTAGAHPTDLVNKWALFFRDAENFDMIPPELDEDPFREAFEIARIVELSDAEYAFYEGQKMKEQDNRGMLVKAREEGEEEGRRQEKEARVAAERRAEEADEARQQEAEARVTVEAELREAMAEIRRLKGTSPND
ncbi:MAG: hypothetical protein GY820_46140, partial [Gammaproteobacteria bacterium]|nr:hypothetical protein [Gammaproteobacteria bacterium]